MNGRNSERSASVCSINIQVHNSLRLLVNHPWTSGMAMSSISNAQLLLPNPIATLLYSPILMFRWPFGRITNTGWFRVLFLTEDKMTKRCFKRDQRLFFVTANQENNPRWNGRSLVREDLLHHGTGLPDCSAPIRGRQPRTHRDIPPGKCSTRSRGEDEGVGGSPFEIPSPCQNNTGCINKCPGDESE